MSERILRILIVGLLLLGVPQGLPAGHGLPTRSTGTLNWAQEHQRLLEMFEGSVGAGAQKIHENIIYCLIMLGRTKEARGEAIALLQQYPQSPKAFAAVVWTLRCDRKESWAMEVLQVGLQRFPGNLVLVNEAAWMMSTAQDPKFCDAPRAVLLAQSVCEADGWKNHHYVDTLAAAHAANGDFTKAVAFQQRAYAMMQERDKRERVIGTEKAGLLNRLASYQRGQRWHWQPPDPER